MKIKYKCKIKSIEYVQVGDWIWTDADYYIDEIKYKANKVCKILDNKLYTSEYGFLLKKDCRLATPKEIEKEKNK